MRFMKTIFTMLFLVTMTTLSCTNEPLKTGTSGPRSPANPPNDGNLYEQPDNPINPNPNNEQVLNEGTGKYPEGPSALKVCYGLKPKGNSYELVSGNPNSFNFCGAATSQTKTGDGSASLISGRMFIDKNFNGKEEIKITKYEV